MTAHNINAPEESSRKIPLGESVVIMKGINKAFSGTPVLKDVDFEVHGGEVHALVGGNGAGKSTLMKILQGVHQKDSGSISIAGNVVELSGIDDARRAGLGMVFQEFSLVSTLTVAQNIYLGDEKVGKGGMLQDKTMIAGARAVLDRMGVDLDPEREVGELSTGYWQLTEIAKALHQDARVLIMDEPTASLSRKESEILFSLIERLKSQGVAIIYISHRMDEIHAISDRITILRDGRRLLTDSLDDVAPEDIVHGISGTITESDMGRPAHNAAIGDVVLEVKNVRCEGVEDVTFHVRKGEVVGLAGFMGSGRTEIAQCLFGIRPATSGTIEVNGRLKAIKSPTDAMDAGIALVPEDRREQGLVLDHSVRDNLLLTLLPSVRKAGLLRKSTIRSRSAGMVERFDVKVADPDKPVSILSGGNQQKVVLAKWIARDADILILDEPTAGVDIGTKQQIIATVRDLAEQGKSVIFISSEFPELIAASDRFILMRKGAVIDELSADQVSDEESLQLVLNGAAK